MAPQIRKPSGDSREEILAIPSTLLLNSSEGTANKIAVEMVLVIANTKPMKKKIKDRK
ncbi:hypothetical protein ABND49_13510 [Paenibacillus larvae]|uniref:Uncharacterized protein n=1 Tax=Paenibacillus larvae TaxID=1464 RepID=A0AAP5JXC9_9BACL|nr:hypothetical protein [Paenibacillus larvae]MDT2253773.1 hypothetical protein [Paenibacillus larvae]